MKKEVRNIIKKRRQNFSASTLMCESEEVMSMIEKLPQFIAAQNVAIFSSLADEPYTHEFIEKWCNKKNILLPIMCEGYTLTLRQYKKGCTMNCAAYNIAEPEGENFPLADVELLIVPGVAFDTMGNRLGRGKGFYDRLLNDTQAFKVGVCFSFQLMDNIPIEPHDVKMDMVLFASK